MKVAAYLEITMKINPENRPAAAKVYTDYRGPFLEQIDGALTKELLSREPSRFGVGVLFCGDRRNILEIDSLYCREIGFSIITICIVVISIFYLYNIFFALLSFNCNSNFTVIVPNFVQNSCCHNP